MRAQQNSFSSAVSVAEKRLWSKMQTPETLLPRPRNDLIFSRPISAFVLTNLLHGSPFLLLATIFQFWMFIHAIRRANTFGRCLSSSAGASPRSCITSWYIARPLRPRAALNCPARKAAGASRNSRRKSITSTRRTTIRSSATFISRKASSPRPKRVTAPRSNVTRRTSTPAHISANACSGKTRRRGQAAARRRRMAGSKHDYGHSMMALAETLLARSAKWIRP